MSKLSCFKAYDVRGKLGEQLNEEIVYRIGRAFAEYLSAQTIVIGCDIRPTSESLKQATIHGMLDAGANVIDLGMTGTEEIYFATSHLNTCGGIEITASHNPIDYNGMKFVREQSKPVGSASGLAEIQSLAENQNFSEPVQKGTLQQQSIRKAYIEKLLSFVNVSQLTKPLKIVINSGNGAAGPTIDALEEKFREFSLPIQLVKINNLPDGNFPNGIPNPMIVERRQATIDAIKHHQADMGIAFDGDFDRCFFFDEQGTFIDGYYIIGLLAQALLHNNPNAKIIHDPRLIWDSIEQIESAGGTAIISQSGHSFMKATMRQTEAIYGGETSAHHYFKDFYYCDSGMVPWLLVLQLLSSSQQSLSQLMQDRMSKFPISGEINFTVSDTEQVIKALEKAYASSARHVDRIDGLAFNFAEWRFNVRSSNTEPLLRLNIESRGDKQLIAKKLKELSQFIKSV